MGAVSLQGCSEATAQIFGATARWALGMISGRSVFDRRWGLNGRQHITAAYRTSQYDPSGWDTRAGQMVRFRPEADVDVTTVKYPLLMQPLPSAASVSRPCLVCTRYESRSKTLTALSELSGHRLSKQLARVSLLDSCRYDHDKQDPRRTRCASNVPEAMTNETKQRPSRHKKLTRWAGFLVFWLAI